MSLRVLLSREVREKLMGRNLPFASPPRYPRTMEATPLALVRIGDIFLNLNLVTHVTFEGHGATAFLACQITDIDGHNGVQQAITFEGPEAHELMWHLQQRASVKPE